MPINAVKSIPTTKAAKYLVTQFIGIINPLPDILNILSLQNLIKTTYLLLI